MRRARPGRAEPRRDDDWRLPARDRTAAGPVLRLQRSLGNRAVAQLLARQATVDEEQIKQREPDAVPQPPVEGEPVEWENFGSLGKFMAELTEEKLHAAGLPSRLFGLIARAWDAYELVEFVESGDAEHLGGPAASVAAKIAEVAAKKIEEGSTSRLAVVGKLGGRVFLVTWTTYEAFKLGAWIAGTAEAEDRARRAARNGWRYAMMQHLWLDYVADLAYEREQMFDLIMGGTGGYGETPALSKEAAIELVARMNDVSDDWKDKLAAWHRLAMYVAEWEGEVGVPDPDPRIGVRYRHRAHVQFCRGEIKKLVASLADEFRNLRDFSNDPANWQLTEQQKETLRTSRQLGPWND